MYTLQSHLGNSFEIKIRNGGSKGVSKNEGGGIFMSMILINNKRVFLMVELFSFRTMRVGGNSIQDKKYIELTTHA